jgi:hypothetical protein
MSYWRLLTAILLWSVPLGVGIGVGMVFVLSAGMGLTVNSVLLGGAVTAAVAGGEAAAALLVLPMVGYYKVYVGPEGVRAFNFWGVYRFARWADVRQVVPGAYLGLLPMLRAYTAGARTPLWLPLFLADRDGFCALVRTHAGDEHPLTVALGEADPP